MESKKLRAFHELFALPLKNGLTRPKSVRGSGVKMVNMGELFAHDHINHISMARVPLSEKEAETYLIESGDLLFARQSLVLEGAGKCSIFLADDEPVTFESHLIRVRLNREIADPHFYYYFFSSELGRRAIETISEQLAAAGIRGSDLSRLLVPFPPLAEQRAIGHLLGTLDDKTELNRQMNETLETMAQALFKSWFADFHPARTKAGDFIREGMLEIGDGYRAKNVELGSEGLPFIRAGNLNNGFDTSGADRLSHVSVARASGKISRVGDVAFTSKGTIGRFARVGETTERFVYSPQICYWRSLDHRRLHPAILYCWMQSGDFMDQVLAVSGQTDMAPYVSLKDQKAMLLPVFDESQSNVGGRIAPLLARQSLNDAESRTLAALRDALLPKLLSGEIRVREAVREMEQAV